MSPVPVPVIAGIEASQAVAASQAINLDPEGVLARIAGNAPELTEGQRARLGGLLRPSREDYLADKFRTVLRGAR